MPGCWGLLKKPRISQGSGLLSALPTSKGSGGVHPTEGSASAWGAPRSGGVDEMSFPWVLINGESWASRPSDREASSSIYSSSTPAPLPQMRMRGLEAPPAPAQLWPGLENTPVSAS